MIIILVTTRLKLKTIEKNKFFNPKTWIDVIIVVESHFKDAGLFLLEFSCLFLVQY